MQHQKDYDLYFQKLHKALNEQPKNIELKNTAFHFLIGEEISELDDKYTPQLIKLLIFLSDEQLKDLFSHLEMSKNEKQSLRARFSNRENVENVIEELTAQKKFSAAHGLMMFYRRYLSKLEEVNKAIKENKEEVNKTIKENENNIPIVENNESQKEAENSNVKKAISQLNSYLSNNIAFLSTFLYFMAEKMRDYLERPDEKNKSYPAKTNKQVFLNYYEMNKKIFDEEFAKEKKVYEANLFAMESIFMPKILELVQPKIDQDLLDYKKEQKVQFNDGEDEKLFKPRITKKPKPKPKKTSSLFQFSEDNEQTSKSNKPAVENKKGDKVNPSESEVELDEIKGGSFLSDKKNSETIRQLTEKKGFIYYCKKMIEKPSLQLGYDNNFEFTLNQSEDGIVVKSNVPQTEYITPQEYVDKIDTKLLNLFLQINPNLKADVSMFQHQLLKNNKEEVFAEVNIPFDFLLTLFRKEKEAFDQFLMLDESKKTEHAMKSLESWLSQYGKLSINTKKKYIEVSMPNKNSAISLKEKLKNDLIINYGFSDKEITFDETNDQYKCYIDIKDLANNIANSYRCLGRAFFNFYTDPYRRERKVDSTAEVMDEFEELIKNPTLNRFFIQQILSHLPPDKLTQLQYVNKDFKHLVQTVFNTKKYQEKFNKRYHFFNKNESTLIAISRLPQNKKTMKALYTCLQFQLGSSLPNMFGPTSYETKEGKNLMTFQVENIETLIEHLKKINPNVKITEEDFIKVNKPNVVGIKEEKLFAIYKDFILYFMNFLSLPKNSKLSAGYHFINSVFKIEPRTSDEEILLLIDNDSENKKKIIKNCGEKLKGLNIKFTIYNNGISINKDYFFDLLSDKKSNPRLLAEVVNHGYNKQLEENKLKWYHPKKWF